MTAETLTGARAAAGVQPAAHSLSGVMHVAYGYYSITSAALEVGDIFKLCKLPKNSLVVGGGYHVADLDTNGSETVDIDLGVADNGGSTNTFVDSAGTTWTNTAADSDIFVNSGVLVGDAITDLLAAGNNYRPFPMTTGPIFFSEETTVQAEVIAIQATAQAGVMYCEIRYIVLG